MTEAGNTQITFTPEHTAAQVLARTASNTPLTVVPFQGIYDKRRRVYMERDHDNTSVNAAASGLQPLKPFSTVLSQGENATIREVSKRTLNGEHFNWDEVIFTPPFAVAPTADRPSWTLVQPIAVSVETHPHRTARGAWTHHWPSGSAGILDRLPKDGFSALKYQQARLSRSSPRPSPSGPVGTDRRVTQRSPPLTHVVPPITRARDAPVNNRPRSYLRLDQGAAPTSLLTQPPPTSTARLPTPTAVVSSVMMTYHHGNWYCLSGTDPGKPDSIRWPTSVAKGTHSIHASAASMLQWLGWTALPVPHFATFTGSIVSSRSSNTLIKPYFCDPDSVSGLEEDGRRWVAANDLGSDFKLEAWIPDGSHESVKQWQAQAAQERPLEDVLKLAGRGRWACPPASDLGTILDRVYTEAEEEEQVRR